MSAGQQHQKKCLNVTFKLQLELQLEVHHQPQPTAKRSGGSFSSCTHPAPSVAAAAHHEGQKKKKKKSLGHHPEQTENVIYLFLFLRLESQPTVLGGKKRDGKRIKGGRRGEECKREILWQRDKVGRETSQSRCQDQSVLSWRFNLMEQCFLVQDNGEKRRMEGWGGKKEENLQDQSLDGRRGEPLHPSVCPSIRLAPIWDACL